MGNLGRNVLHGPTLAQFDLTVQKRFRIHEQTNLEFRAEMYNLFNRANFANPPVQLNQSLGTGANQLQPDVPFTPAAAGGETSLRLWSSLLSIFNIDRPQNARSATATSVTSAKIPK